MTIWAVEGLLLEGTRKLPQLHALGMKHMAAPRHHLAIHVRDHRPRTDGAPCLVEKQVHLLEEILDLLHGARAVCTQDDVERRLFLSRCPRLGPGSMTTQACHGRRSPAACLEERCVYVVRDIPQMTSTNYNHGRCGDFSTKPASSRRPRTCCSHSCSSVLIAERLRVFQYSVHSFQAM